LPSGLNWSSWDISFGKPMSFFAVATSKMPVVEFRFPMASKRPSGLNSGVSPPSTGPASKVLTS
jgi:hypothetical protein